MTTTIPSAHDVSRYDYDELITRLDLPTKVKLLTGATTFTLHPEPSIGHRATASYRLTGVLAAGARRAAPARI